MKKLTLLMASPRLSKLPSQFQFPVVTYIDRKIKWIYSSLDLPVLSLETANRTNLPFFIITALSNRLVNVGQIYIFIIPSEYYALINQARGPYEEIFVLTFEAYGPSYRGVRITQAVETSVSIPISRRHLY